MAELWQGLQCLVTASLADCEVARLNLSSTAAGSEALQAAMPVLQDHYARWALLLLRQQLMPCAWLGFEV